MRTSRLVSAGECDLSARQCASPGGECDSDGDDSRRQRHGKPRVCGLAQNLCHNFPHPSAGRQKAATTLAELVACTLLAGGGRLRVPNSNICGCALVRNAKQPFFRDLLEE